MAARKRSSMGKLADQTARDTDEELRDQELAMLADTAIDWESLRPQVADQETYNRLMDEVRKSTAKNESLAQLRRRLEKLGTDGVALVKKVARMMK